MEKQKTKGTPVMGRALVVGMGSGCVGNMAWETPLVRFAIHGERYTWQSDMADRHSLHVGDHVWMSAFARQDSDRLYRVQILNIDREL